MQQEKTKLQGLIESGKQIVLAEISPPKTADGASVRNMAKRLSGTVHALGVSDNRDGIRMSALAAASLILSENVEPVLHFTTRDRNRTALIADCLGAHALGIRNILCTSGTHQSLLPFHAAKNVFDFDATLFLQTCKNLENSAVSVGEEKIAGPLHFCLGAVAAPYADPLELQLPRLAQKIFVGAQFLITQPVFDMDRFNLWWKEVTNRGLHEKAAFIVGIRVLTDAAMAKEYAEKRPLPMVPDAILSRLAAKSDKSAARAEGIKIALETIEKLSGVAGIRGLEIVCDDDLDAAAEILKSLQSKIG
ncbi:MAG: methylenetetrahydrofolate reductase [Chitinivibrionales bacterium]|nr:methylenetetrahydrofolate reductase [Chitinivibrionales bacterium]